MSGDTERGRSGQTGLEDVHDVSIDEQSGADVMIQEIAGRWQTVLAIAALAVTSGTLWYMDGGFSLDMVVFAILTVLLLLYFAITLVNDVKME
jgi:hypothetical protein